MSNTKSTSNTDRHTVEFELRSLDAVNPVTTHGTDTGIDITCISLKKVLPTGVHLFDTGLAVKPPTGYYTEIVPRSSIIKTGWMLANSIGIIDDTYTGNLLIALVPMSDNSIELKPPFCVAQLILCKLELIHPVVGKIETESTRGAAGFGSTG